MNNTSGVSNTADGVQALYANATGVQNTAVGAGALLHNNGSGNTAVGWAALFANTGGTNNIAEGYQALLSNTTGNFNTAVGYQALKSNTTGSLNTAIGEEALFNNTTGVANTALGLGAGNNVTTANNVIAILSPGANVSNSCFIGFIRGVTTANADAVPVVIDSDGQLGTMSSSRRYKKEIKPMDQTSESILALKPVTFQYKSDSQGMPQFGLVAEEVAEVNPDLVVRDAEGEIYTVRYDAVNAMLLNEFLKEHRTVQELRASDAEQKKEIVELKQQLHDQAEAIRKVSERVELSALPMQVVANQQ